MRSTGSASAGSVSVRDVFNTFSRASSSPETCASRAPSHSRRTGAAFAALSVSMCRLISGIEGERASSRSAAST